MGEAAPTSVGHTKPGRGRFSDAILDSIHSDGIFTVDHDLVITSFNQGAQRITGVPREDAIGRSCNEVFRVEGRALEESIERALGPGAEPVVNTAFYFHHRLGTQLAMSLSVSALTERGESLGAVATFRDLTGVFERYLSGTLDDPRGDLRKQLLQQTSFADIISRNHEMRRIFAILPEIARSRSTVLIEGPSGAGKELFARAIHDLSPCRDGPLVVVNCGAMPDTLLESELFGYQAGAFTDAKRNKPGRFAVASGGTLFLDEIGDVSPAMQVRLLRVLQDGVFEPLGATRPVKVDVRVITATNKNLDELVSAGEFREDLFYRLNVVRLGIPPLKARREDVPLLVEHFVSKLRSRRGKMITGISDDALSALLQHDFPGNVRELQNAIEFAFVVCRGGPIQRDHLPPKILQASETDEKGESAAPMSLDSRMEKMETKVLSDALVRNRFNASAAARELGIHRTTLWRRAKKLGLRIP